MIVYAVVDDALSPDFPLGDALDYSSAARTPSGSSRRCEETIPRPQRSSGPRSGSWRRAGWTKLASLNVMLLVADATRG
jgi:hypothetical protein